MSKKGTYQSLARGARQHQVRTAERLVEEAEKRAQQTEQEMQQLEAARDQIVDQLENAGDSCRVPDSAIERLRNIR